MNPGLLRKLTKYFLLSAGGIFAITAAAKLYSAMGEARILGLDDPILGTSNRSVLMFVGLTEAALAVLLFTSKYQWLKLPLVTWMATNFLVYRIGLWWMDSPKTCSCLGTITDSLSISPRFLDLGMKAVFLYLLLGSYSLLLAHWKQPASSGESSPQTA